jgi:hypothetical protein
MTRAASHVTSLEERMRILFVLVVLVAVVSVGLVVEMQRRKEPILGLTALGLLTVDGLLGVTYGFLGAE